LQAYQPLEQIFTSHHTRLIFISSSTNEQTKEFITSATVKVPGELFGDPAVGTHKLFALKSGIFRSIFMPLWSGMKKYGFKGIVEGFRLGYETSHLAGASWQQGGVVLLDNDGKIVYQHTEEHPADWPDLKPVFQRIGVPDATVDYSTAVKTWTNSRDEQRANRAK